VVTKNVRLAMWFAEALRSCGVSHVVGPDLEYARGCDGGTYPFPGRRIVAEVVQLVSMLDERGLDLGALAETQGRVGRQRFPIAEHP
jgi:hypothetical protein